MQDAHATCHKDQGHYLRHRDTQTAMMGIARSVGVEMTLVYEARIRRARGVKKNVTWKHDPTAEVWAPREQEQAPPKDPTNGPHSGEE